MATIRTGYTPTTVTAPVAPSTTSVLDMNIMGPLIREIWQTRVIDEPRMKWEITSAESFFEGERLLDIGTLMNSLPYGQQLIVPIKKDQNPFDLYQSSALTYDDINACHKQLDLDCTMPCISTAPSYNTLVFAFDTEYAYGVRVCVKTQDFYDFNWYSDQYALSREAKDYGREVDLWNKVITTLKANPATTVDVSIAQAHPTHYWSNLGAFSATIIDDIRNAFRYFMNSYEVTPTIFMTQELGQKIIASQQTVYNQNFATQRVNTFEQWDIPGFMVDEQVRMILGFPTTNFVVFIQRSPWMTWQWTTGAGTTIDPTVTHTKTNYPLWSADMTKEYIAILDPRVGYQFAKQGYQLNIMPCDCDKMYKGMIDTEYVGSGVTFAQYGMLLEINNLSWAQAPNA